MEVLDYIQLKINDGWEISVECKGKGREYECTYEALCSQPSDKVEDMFGWNSARHAVGDSFAECISGLFGDEVSDHFIDARIQEKMSECWNITLGFTKGEISGHAKQIQDDYDEQQKSMRYADGKDLPTLFNNLFVTYDPNNSYAKNFRRKMELLETENPF